MAVSVFQKRSGCSPSRFLALAGETFARSDFRRRAAVSCAIFVLLATACAASRAATETSKASAAGRLTIHDATGSPGGTATVSITMDERVKNLAGVLMVVQFDPALTLTEKDVAVGSLLPSPMKSANLKIKGRVTLGFITSKSAQGPGELARLTFRLPSGAPTGKAYPIQVVTLETNDENADLFPVKTQDGSIRVGKGGKKDLRDKGRGTHKNPK